MRKRRSVPIGDAAKALLAAAGGLLFGAILPGLATWSHLTLKPQPRTIDHALALHLNNPVFWIMDAAPLLLGTVAGLAYCLQLRQARQQSRAQQLLSRRLVATLGAVNAGILIEDADRRIWLANPELCSIFGIPAPPESLVGVDCKQVSEDQKGMFEDPQAFIAGVDSLLLARLPVFGQRLRCSDGRVLERDYAPVFLGASYQGHIWSYRDVTAADRLLATEREASERTNFLMRIVNHGVVVADVNDAIVEWSPGAEDMFGYPSNEMQGQPLTRLVAESHREDFAREIEQVKAQAVGGARIITRGLKQHGQEVDLEVAMAAWATDKGRMLGAVIRDISKQKLAEQRVHDVEKNWRDIAENSSDVLFLLDSSGMIVFANRAFRGTNLEQLIGADIGLILPDLGPLLRDALLRVFERRIPFEHESRSSESGKESWLWCRLAPQSEDGEVVRAVLSISDFGERRARDLASRRLAAIVQTSNDAVVSTDPAGHVATWNGAAEKLWGWSESEILGRGIDVLCPPEQLGDQSEAILRLKAGQHLAAFDATRITKDGRRIPVSISLSAIRDAAGTFQGASAVLRDMSHYRELQTELERAKAVAEAASQLKSEFLANMSHEIRTPLNGVVGMADLLRATVLTTEQEGYVATLLEASQALRVVVDDILDFSKIEAGQLDIEKVEFDLRTLASGAVDMFRHAARQSETKLEFSIDTGTALRVLGDPNRIRQVLINLVNNAVKFTKRGSVRVRVSTREAGVEGWVMRAEVEDTGVGISTEAQARIFQPFAQADGSITRQFGGSGLGLSICRKLLALMGGDIGFSSRPGAGSTFWFEVALGKAEGSGTKRSAARSSLLPKNNTSWRILVAEDNPINQKVVSAMLIGLGCSVDIAHNGRAAFDCWKRGVYDLILMDCQMPEMSGFEATVAIRAIEGTVRTPIIAMTAQAYAVDRERCARAGMDDHLAKPLTKSELRTALAKWLRLASPAPLDDVATKAPAACIDTQALERLESDLGEGGAEVLGSLIDGFLAEFPEALTRLHAAMADEDWESVAFQAHRLRSSTSNLAAVELSSLCEELEDCGKRAASAGASRLMVALQDEFVRVGEALCGYVRRDAPSSEQRQSRTRPGAWPRAETES